MATTEKIKTYGVKGVSEWHAIIPCKGGARLRADFTGGTANEAGWVPARFRTGNAVVQALIEGSAYFKKGKIFLVSATDKPAKTDAVAVAKAMKAAKKAKAAAAKAAEVTPVKTPITATVAAPAETPKEEDAAEPAAPVPAAPGKEAQNAAAAPAEEDAAEDASQDEGSAKVVKVSDIEGEGRKYLINECGVAKSKLIGKAAVIAEAAKQGIVFEVAE